MNVQIADYSTDRYIDRTEYYPDGTVTKKGNVYDDGYFSMQVTTQRNDGYRKVEQVNGIFDRNGVSNVQTQTVSEQLPYAPNNYLQAANNQANASANIFRIFSGG
jgi:hypothetical protein